MTKRKIITLTLDQARWLHKEAKRLGTSGTDVIRRLLDKARGVL